MLLAILQLITMALAVAGRSKCCDRGHHVILQERDYNQRFRYTEQGCVIYGYPSSGGIIVKEGNMVDMQALGWDKLSPPEKRFEDLEEEDAFCRNLWKLDPVHWSCIYEYHEAELNPIERAITAEPEEFVRHYAWPSPVPHADSDKHGVWYFFLDVRHDETQKEPDWELAKKEGSTLKLSMAATLSEKVEIMKEIGATFYPNPRECPGLEKAYPTEEPKVGSNRVSYSPINDAAMCRGRRIRLPTMEELI